MSQNEKNVEEKAKKIDNTMIYCHFSFKRPKGENYGLFAVAFYRDFNGKNKITHKTRKFDLWQNHQFITAIQAYEHALMTIQEYQGMMREAGINQVMLVTDNSTLAKWIEVPTKNKKYTPYLQRAVKQYRVGGPKEIVIGIGLCEPRDSEKSYKYCKEALVCNNYTAKKDNKATGYKLQVGEYKSVLDIIEGDISIPETVGMEEVTE